MRDTLPKNIYKKECGIVNLDSNSGPGTHWVCYSKIGNEVSYYNSFGKLKPPLELISYFKNSKILYNYQSDQSYDSFVCGHLCLLYLYNENKKM